jgi:hypothetical protein
MPYIGRPSRKKKKEKRKKKKEKRKKKKEKRKKKKEKKLLSAYPATTSNSADIPTTCDYYV